MGELMTKYALVGDTTKEILREVEGDKEFKNGSPPDLPLKDFSWLPLVEEDRPEIDHETEVWEGPEVAVNETEVTRSWSVRAKTDEELGAQTEKFLDDLLNFRGFVAFLNALDNGTIQPGADVGIATLREKIKEAM